MKIFLLLALVAVASAQNTVTRASVQSYLENVFTAPAASQWQSLSDTEIFTLYDNLTFYFPSAPAQSQVSVFNTLYPNGRPNSHPYAGTVCDCLHIQLDMCQKFSPSSTCNYWPVDTYMNMAYVTKFEQGFPSNSWFEGLSFPGEWAFPLSCLNNNLGQGVYGFNNHIWLYPITGFGVWWNTGNTAWAFNKVDWIIRNGVGQSANGLTLGSTPTEVFITLANTVCPGFQTRTNSQCDDCPYSQTGSTSKCCCHGPGYNLGTQIIQLQQQNGITLQSAISTVMSYYQQGYLGQDGQQSYYYPTGTYFAYRDLLDPIFMALQVQLGFDSVQFIREPQHSGGSGTPSSPAYAFEFLMQNQNWQYSWGTFCSSNEIAVLNPLDHLETYTTNGYIANPQNIQSISTWTPTPQFNALFQLNANAYMSSDNAGVESKPSSSGAVHAISIAVPVIVCALLVVAVAMMYIRRRRYISQGVELVDSRA